VEANHTVRRTIRRVYYAKENSSKLLKERDTVALSNEILGDAGGCLNVVGIITCESRAPNAG